MEPSNTKANNSEFQEYTYDDQLEEVMQELNKVAESSGAKNFDDLLDLYINKSWDCSFQNPQPTVDYKPAFKDFNNFQSTQIPQEQSKHVKRIHGFDIDRQLQESEQIIQDMMENANPNDTGRFPESSQTATTNSDVEVVKSSIKVTHIRYGDLNCHEAADGIIGSVFGGSIDTMLASVRKEKADGTTRRKVRRRYRGVTETEQNVAPPVEQEQQILKTERQPLKHM